MVDSQYVILYSSQVNLCVFCFRIYHYGSEIYYYYYVSPASEYHANWFHWPHISIQEF